MTIVAHTETPDIKAQSYTFQPQYSAEPLLGNLCLLGADGTFYNYPIQPGSSVAQALETFKRLSAPR